MSSFPCSGSTSAGAGGVDTARCLCGFSPHSRPADTVDPPFAGITKEAPSAVQLLSW